MWKFLAKKNIWTIIEIAHATLYLLGMVMAIVGRGRPDMISKMKSPPRLSANGCAKQCK
jgi:hypothetical protein